jgi:hypothetical protein
LSASSAYSQDGTLKWKFKTACEIWFTPAIGDDGTIYVFLYFDYIKIDLQI